MIPALIQLIIWLLIVGLLFWLLTYVVDNFIPDPPARIIKVVVMVVLAIIVILALLNLLGIETGMPRLVPQ
jgi:uncharacterized membrane protein YwzB